MIECISCRRDTDTSGISFFKFPKDEAKLKPWIENMGFDSDWKPLEGNFLCSLHFSNECFIDNYLKKDSVPTIFEDDEINYEPHTSSEICIQDGAVDSFVFSYNEPDVNEIKKEPDIIEDVENEVFIGTDIHEIKKEIKSETEDLNDNTKERSNFKIDIIKEEVVETDSLVTANSGADIHDNQKQIKNEPEYFSSEVAMNEVIPIYDKDDTQVDILTIKEFKVDNFMNSYKEIDKNTENRKLLESNEEPLDVEVIVQNEINESYENFKRKNEEVDISDVELNLNEDSYPVNCELSTSDAKPTIVSTKRKHRKNKVIKKVFICDNCNTLFKNKSALIQHIKKHPKELTSCDDCSYKTYYTNDLKQHVNVKHIQKSLRCSFCNYETYYQNDLDKHVDNKHAIRKKFTCTICYYTTHNKSEYNEHEHVKKPKRPSFSCTYCKYSSYYKKDLKRHVNSIHTKTITFSCPSCDYKAYRKTHLDLHINAKHSKTASFDCSFCSFKTFYKYDLNKHIRFQHP